MRSARRPSHALREPTSARYLLLAALLLVTPETSRAEPAAHPTALTERDVVARALGRAPLTDVIEGEVAVEEGRGRAAGTRPNPQLSYAREQTFGAFGSTESYLSVSQVIDLGARRGWLRKAGDARARAARRQGEAARLATAAEARLRFYAVLHREGRVAILEGWIGRIDQALSIVSRREQRGDAAVYDRRRLDRERAIATARLEKERAALERAIARLQALLGIGGSPASVDAVGTLLPRDEPGDPGSPRAGSGRRPDLLAQDLYLEAASHDRTAASRWWAPELRLEGGWKGVDLGPQGRTDGFVLGASLSVPLWDELEGLSRAAEGEARAARGRRALLQTGLEGELGGARAEAVRLRRAAVRFREEIAAVSRDLVRIASAGYEGGELGLLELLDAFRGAVEDSLSALDLEHAARRARIQLDRLSGGRLP